MSGEATPSVAGAIAEINRRFAKAGERYGEIETSDLIFDVACDKCGRPANSDECEHGCCPDCTEEAIS